MDYKNIFTPKNIKTIAVIAILFAVLNLGLNFLQTPKYKSSAKLIVVSNQTETDVYNVSQTSGYIVGVLGEVINSSLFIDNVFLTNYQLTDDLGQGLEKRLQNWQEIVHVQVDETKGMLKIDVLHPDRTQADQYAKAIIDTILVKHEQYHGAKDTVALKVIDTPITSQKWAEPNIIKNTLLGIVAGLVLGLTFIVLFPNQKIFEKILKFRYQALQHEIDLIKTFQKHQEIEEKLAGAPAGASMLGSEDETTPEHYFSW